MARTYTRLLYHLVFSTKHRVPSITARLAPRLHAYLGGIVRAEKGIALAVGGVADHVHLLVSWRVDKPLAGLLRSLKGRSSTWVHESFADLGVFYWQDGYGAFTVSPSQAETVERYILDQERHHRRRSFEDEFRRLLESHGLTFEKRYALD